MMVYSRKIGAPGVHEACSIRSLRITKLLSYSLKHGGLTK